MKKERTREDYRIPAGDIEDAVHRMAMEFD
jgi:hypothetical protein